jgi:hypothetical protein
MARLQSNTRIYGTANVDTSMTIGTGVGNTTVFANSSTISIGNSTVNTSITSSGLTIANNLIYGYTYAAKCIYF